jgi:hypothetical protein
MFKFEQQIEKMKELAELEKLTHKWKKLYNKEPEIFSHDSEIFANILREKYPHFEKYRLFHLLAGSSDFKNCDEDKFDFPDEEYSIKNFIDSEYEKIKK